VTSILPVARVTGRAEFFRTSLDDRAVWTSKTVFGNRSSSFSGKRLSGPMSRPLRTESLKKVPPLPNCCIVFLLSVVVELKDIHVTYT
jgi:hypothetical protein